jgi:ankyrin repeat protein
MDKLVGLGAEIALQDSEGRSPLMYAVMSGDEKLVEWFVAKHSENAFDVN